MGFFNLSKALEEVSDAFGAKETAIASAKLLGKGVVNLAHFAATTGLDSVVKQTSNKVLNSESSTEEQREQAKKLPHGQTRESPLEIKQKTPKTS
ncbi:hypothetical protein CK247_29130 [Klebsiella pneumoniae]|nr:hypothetical protein CK247_29130 [Klebsiella pneumoniae]